VPVVAFEAGFLAGLRAEPADKGGVSGMTAGMLTKGPEPLRPGDLGSGRERRRELSVLRAQFLRIAGEVPQARFPAGVPPLRGVAPGARVPATSWKEAAGDPRALKQQKDQLTQAAFLLFMDAHYGSHPYARNPLGTERPQGDDAGGPQEFYERWADPRNMVIAVSGDIGRKKRSMPSATLRRLPATPVVPAAGPLPARPRRASAGRRSRGRRSSPFRHRLSGARFTDPTGTPRRPRLASQDGGRLFVNYGTGNRWLLRHIVLLRAVDPALRLLHGDERGQARHGGRRHAEGDRRGSEGGSRGRSSSGRRSG
jgi:hypothetical protein